MNKVNILKETSKQRHISFYYRGDNNKLKRCDIVTNEEFIRKFIDPNYRVPNTDNFIFGFDYVTSSFVGINVETILWDEINGFYDICSSYEKSQIKKCENTLKFIGSSSFKLTNNYPRKLNKIYKRKKSKYSNFTFQEYALNNGNDFLFDDFIDGKHYQVVIEHKYVMNNKKICRNKERQFLCWMISEQAIKKYIDSLQNDLIS